MGFPKALLPFRGGTFLTEILDTIEGLDVDPPLVVLGSHAVRIDPLLKERRARVLINPDPSQGQLSSIRLAIAALDPRVDGCLIWPVDHPDVSAALVTKMLFLFERKRAAIVMPRCGNRRGHPAIFHRLLFGELLETPLDQGALPVVRKHEGEIELIETDETGTIADIDTPEDYEGLTGNSIADLPFTIDD